MDDQAKHAAFMSALVTEHFVLQSASSTTVTEAGSRASLYVFSLSSSLVAMGFAVESEAFSAFVGTVLPALFILGWFTVMRLADTAVESYRFQEAIAHVRAYYRSLSPEASYYFPPWRATDVEAAEALAMLGTRPRRLTVLSTTAPSPRHAATVSVAGHRFDWRQPHRPGVQRPFRSPGAGWLGAVRPPGRLHAGHHRAVAPLLAP